MRKVRDLKILEMMTRKEKLIVTMMKVLSSMSHLSSRNTSSHKNLACSVSYTMARLSSMSLQKVKKEMRPLLRAPRGSQSYSRRYTPLTSSP